MFAEDIEIYASDTMHGKSQEDKAGRRVFLSLTVGSREKGEEIFKQLAEKEKINVPFEKQFWGAWHGNLVDRFGISWMVKCG